MTVPSAGAGRGDPMRGVTDSRRKLQEMVNTPGRQSARPRTPGLAPRAAERDPVRQRLDNSFDRVAPAKFGTAAPHDSRHRSTELQREIDLHRSVGKDPSTSGRVHPEQLQVSGTGIRQAARPDVSSRVGVRWAEADLRRPSSSPDLAHPQLQHGGRLHGGSAALHGSLDLGPREVRSSEVSMHALLGQRGLQRSPEPRERRTAVVDSPTQAVLERHMHRRGSPRRPSRLRLEDPPVSPDGGAPRRGRSQSPRKKPVLAQLDVENLEHGVGPDGFSETPNRAALGDVTPSRNWQVRTAG